MNDIKEFPLVSVCIPCYNAVSTIKETLDSVLSQSYTNLEIIICDDQSKDKTLEILKKYTDQRIRIFLNEKNLACAGNFQEALSKATGKYAKLLCADDVLREDCIEKQVAVFESHSTKNIAMVTAEKNVINENGKILFSKPYPGTGGLKNGRKSIRKSIRNGTNIFGEPGLPLVSVEKFKKTRGYLQERKYLYGCDMDMWFQLLMEGDLYVIKEKLFSFRVISTSGSAAIGWKQAKEFNTYLKYIQDNQLYPVSSSDFIIGKMMAYLMCLARNIIFKVF